MQYNNKSNRKRKPELQTMEDERSPYLDFRGLKMHRESHPLILSPDLTIFVEKQNPLYEVAYELLMSIAEPLNRSQHIHEYRINQMSLYTAMVLQYSPNEIIKVLEMLSKNSPPEVVQEYIRKHTMNMGQARFYLNGEEGAYYLELGVGIADVVLNEIGRISQQQKIVEEVTSLKQCSTMVINPNLMHLLEMNSDEQEQQDIAATDNTNTNDYRVFKVIGDYFIVTESLINSYVPLIQEYDLNKCFNRLSIEMRGGIKPRLYQQRAIRNVIIAEKARSGLIVLPCGAGKTMVGIMCIEQMKSSAIIICDSNVSVDQWRREFEKYTTLNPKNIVRITGYVKDKWTGEMPIILLTTYSWLIAQINKQNNNSQWSLIIKQQWGICLVDEVHRLPAQQFCNVLRMIKCAVKIGLTATLLREDQKLDNLYYMIGPKLYEENLIDLMSQGYLAKPYIVEVLCDMTPIFMQEYHARQSQTRTLLHTANPTKFTALQFLIKHHEILGHKIIVFCDSLLVLNHFANLLGYPIIDGELNTDEKNKIFNLFKSSNEIKTIFVSRVGDTGIDIPSASVGIEIGYLGGSRRQKVQRLGRVMRPKQANQTQEFSAFFYSLASKDTVESEYSFKRQKYITEQLGLNTELINESELPYNKMPLKYKFIKKLDELELLEQILMTDNKKQTVVEDVYDDEQQVRITRNEKTYQSELPGIYKII